MPFLPALKMRKFTLAVSLLLLMRTIASQGQELTVAAAADLAACLPKINEVFQKEHPGAALKVSFGSSGNFATQIRNGAPFEVFLSADTGYPRALAKDGLAEAASLAVYAHGQIALWTMDAKMDLSQGLKALSDPAVQRIAIANPDHAPYGRAAKAALEHEHLWEAVQPRLVTGENISQTAQFVETGNAQAGIVALSLLAAPGAANKGHYQLIPREDYPPIEQAAIVTKAGAGHPLARAYVDFLRSKEAAEILRQFGFQQP